ncbi:MAG: glutamate formimidoyltransferase [Actinobacteria bacterium]|nr:glutamate formimidoyltransferase [Actinomycetota bacterium]
MRRLMECVPNVSEGRNCQTITELASVLQTTPGISLLDSSSDIDHNRAVFTYVGEPEAMLAGTEAFCRRAFDLIDMTTHTGGHPRLGAVDVVPFVPLRGVEMAEAVDFAHRLGRAVGEMGVPVYFYEEAALSPQRRDLTDVRRGEYESLPSRLAEPSGRPDAGPATFNPRSGACIIGARRPLIAFNVNLGTTDLDVAQRIARTVRYSNGGFRAVKAMGVELKELGVVQVSMNLTDYTQTPIHRVVEAIRSEAARYGVPVVGSELVGLTPLEALDGVVRYYLQLHEFSSAKIIESHLL